MENPQFFFLTNRYYRDFPDDGLIENTELINGVPYGRPFFLSFSDPKNSKILWGIPVSLEYEKYRRIEQKEIRKCGCCNTIRFGEMLGKQAAFLIRNMFPVTNCYLIPYIDHKRWPVGIDFRTAADIRKNARKVLAEVQSGSKFVLPDIQSIYTKLEDQLRLERMQKKTTK